MFFVKAVSATVEVKSRLTKKDIHQAAQASKHIKSYHQSPPQRFNTNRKVYEPRPYCFLFAYDAKVSLRTIAKWVGDVSEEEDYGLERLVRTPRQDRYCAFHSFLDGIFILNKDHILADCMAFRPSGFEEEFPADYVWICSDLNELERMWMTLTTLSEGLHWNMLDVIEYASPRRMRLSNRKNLVSYYTMNMLALVECTSPT